jgi:hypothetical protein
MVLIAAIPAAAERRLSHAPGNFPIADFLNEP